MDKLEFKVGEKKYYIKKPTQREINEGEFVYKTKYSEALRFGALTGAEASKIIESREIWNKEDDKKLAELFLELSVQSKVLEDTNDLAEGAALLNKMFDIRNQILKLNLKRNNILDNTAESYADDHRLQYYVVACTFDETNKKVFATLDDFLDQANSDLGKKALVKTIHLIANDGRDFLEDWPETVWKKKHGLLTDDLEPIEAKFEEVVQAEIDAKEQKKKPRKKKQSTK